MNITQTMIRQLETWFLRRAAPLPLIAVPDQGFSASASPAWYANIGSNIIWRAADATQDYARVTFRLPAGLGTTPLIVRGLIAGTATSENIIIKTYKASLASGDVYGWDTANSAEQASIAVAATLIEVTIATLMPTAAGDVIALAFRPRTTADANVAQNKVLVALWLQ